MGTSGINSQFLNAVEKKLKIEYGYKEKQDMCLLNSDVHGGN